MSDNHHVSVISSSMSCGVAELSRITSDPEKVLYAVATSFYHPSRGSSYAFLQWSDTTESNGVKFADFINSIWGELSGTPVDQTEWVDNPKTGNTICIWTWEIPHAELKKWYINQRMVRAKTL